MSGPVNIKRTLARVLLALVSTLLCFGAAEFAYRWLAADEVTERNLHTRYEQHFRDADRKEIDAAVAAQRGLVVPVSDAELIRVGPVLDSTAAEFRRAADGSGLAELVAPADDWKRPGIAGERLLVTGSAHNDGGRTVIAFADGVLRTSGPVAAEDGGAGVHVEALRNRLTWGPSETFYLCYRGLQDDPQRAAYFDRDGCVECTTNSAGIREREAVIGPKPAGQRRIVCIGDSFTFGWGVKVEDCWVRRVEVELRRTDDAIRTVNCGAAGAIYVDEYASALEHRFGRFEPDAVVITLCLNDLLPTSNALAHSQPLRGLLAESRILRDLFQSYALAATLQIDPRRDLVGELLALPDEAYPPWVTLFPPNSVGRRALWSGGGAQDGLRRAHAWCASRGVAFGVVIWPYFQGLGQREHYPFTKMHELVREFCAAEDIPFLDLLPTFEKQVALSSDLWVCLADYHGNERAQAMATPPLTSFLGGLLGPR